MKLTLYHFAPLINKFKNRSTNRIFKDLSEALNVDIKSFVSLKENLNSPNNIPKELVWSLSVDKDVVRNLSKMDFLSRVDFINSIPNDFLLYFKDEESFIDISDYKDRIICYIVEEDFKNFTKEPIFIECLDFRMNDKYKSEIIFLVDLVKKASDENLDYFLKNSVFISKMKGKYLSALPNEDKLSLGDIEDNVQPLVDLVEAIKLRKSVFLEHITEDKYEIITGKKYTERFGQDFYTFTVRGLNNIAEARSLNEWKEFPFIDYMASYSAVNEISYIQFKLKYSPNEIEKEIFHETIKKVLLDFSFDVNPGLIEAGAKKLLVKNIFGDSDGDVTSIPNFKI